MAYTSVGALFEECRKRGIEISETSSKNSLLSALTRHSLSRETSFRSSYGLTMRSRIESPMLCFSYSELTSTEKDNILKSERWIAEPKFYGCRVIICYHPKEGFRFFSRSVSDQDFLPIEFTDRMLLNEDGVLKEPNSWVGAYPFSFVLDGEAYSKNGLRRKGDVEPYLGFENNYVSLILEESREESLQIQATKFPITVSVFDVLYFCTEEVWKYPLQRRKEILRDLLSKGNTIRKIPLDEVAYTSSGKPQFIRALISAGYEGAVLKNLDMPYIPFHKSRIRDIQVRLKRRDFDRLNDIDVFITGMSLRNKHSLLVSSYVLGSDGIEEEVELGEVEVPELLIPTLFVKMSNSDIVLPKAWVFGKVLTVKVTGFNPFKTRFSSIMPNWKTGFREDKNRYDCVIEREFIDSIIRQKIC